MKTALITGASSGIGYELAKIFAKNKNNLVLVARNENKLNELANELMNKHNVKIMVIPMDLSKQNAAQKIYNQVKQENIEVEYLINNAGFGYFGMFYETDWNKEEQMLNLNIKTLTEFTKLFVKDMITRKSGRILNLGSTASFQPCPTMAAYGATKSYVLSFSGAIANELKGTGVTVSVLCPGNTKSRFQEVAEMDNSNVLKGKFATSEEVAEYGYKIMMKGKRIAIHGFKNRLLANCAKFIPRNLAAAIVRKILSK